jgi:hypothetical protein
MTQEDMINFLRRVYVWVPSSNPISKEVKQVVELLGGSVSELAEWKKEEKSH